MPLTLDLNKSAGKLKLSLEKKGVITPPVVEVAFDLDVSGSYEGEHASGVTNLLMTRLVPWGLVFDPDKQLDVFTFSNGEDNVFNVGPVNAENYHTYVRDKVIGKVPGWRGGTEYVHVLRKNLELFGWIRPPVSLKKPGFFSGLFGGGSKPSPTSVAQRKSLVLFNTDGDNDDRDKFPTIRLFEQMQRDRLGMYVMFLGVSRRRDDFGFLQELANRFDNCGLTVIPNVRTWVEKDDDELNEELITPELVSWLNAKQTTL